MSVRDPYGNPRKPARFSQCSKILRVLEDGPATAAGIHRIAGSSRLNSRISELRKRGYVITCEHVPGGTGPEAYVYTLCAGEPSGSLPSPSGGLRSEAVAVAGIPSPASPAQLTLDAAA